MREPTPSFEPAPEQGAERSSQELNAFLGAYSRVSVVDQNKREQAYDMGPQMQLAMEVILKNIEPKNLARKFSENELKEQFAQVVDQYDVDQIEGLAGPKAAKLLPRGTGVFSIHLTTGAVERINEEDFRSFSNSPRGQFLNGRDLLLLAITAYNMHKRGIQDPNEPTEDDMEKTITIEDYRRVRKNIITPEKGMPEAPIFIKHLALTDPKVTIPETPKPAQPKEAEPFTGEVPELPKDYEAADAFCNDLIKNHLTERGSTSDGEYFGCQKDGVSYSLEKRPDYSGVNGAWTIIQEVPGRRPKKRQFPGTPMKF